MRRGVIGFLGGAALLALAATSTVSAHHAFAAEYDWKKPVTITGTVTRVDWSNPHAFLFIDGKDEGGNSAMWKLELGGLRALSRYGWNKAMLKQGEQVTADGWLAKDGSKTVSARTVKIGGKELFAASSFFDMNMRQTKQENRQARR